MSDIEEVEQALKKKKKKQVIPANKLLNSGSTLLNLAVTGRTFGCYVKGKFYWFVGDSTSGKTWLALSAFAEAAMNENFDDYRFIYDNSEDGALMDIEKFFGKKVKDRLEPPRGTKEAPEYSELTEDLYFNIDDAVKQGKPFIYVIDSIDALDTKDDQSKFRKMKSHRQSGSQAKLAGSMGMAKAKINSAFVRRIVRGCRDTGSIVIVISQTRDNVGFGAKFNPKVAAGGRALKFFATTEIWTSVKGKIKRMVKAKWRSIGILSKVVIKKNRVEGKDRSVIIPIYPSFGVDDIGCCVNYLADEGHWSGTKPKGQELFTKVNAPEFEYKGDVDGLVKQIEENEEEKELRALVRKTWDEIESASRIERKSRYA